MRVSHGRPGSVGVCDRVKKYFGECSLLFLHKDTVIRRFLIKLTLKPGMRQKTEQKKANGDSDTEDLSDNSLESEQQSD